MEEIASGGERLLDSMTPRPSSTAPASKIATRITRARHFTPSGVTAFCREPPPAARALSDSL
jgi:hypothetical protein